MDWLGPSYAASSSLSRGRQETEAEKNAQQGDSKPLDSGKKPFQTPRSEELPPEKGEMAVQDRDGGGTCFYRTHTLYQQAPFSQGSLFLKLPSWSGFCLVWRSNLTANYSRLEKQLTWASELWGKLAKLPNLFLLLNNISLTAKAVK